MLSTLVAVLATLATTLLATTLLAAALLAAALTSGLLILLARFLLRFLLLTALLTRILVLIAHGGYSLSRDNPAQGKQMDGALVPGSAAIGSAASISD